MKRKRIAGLNKGAMEIRKDFDEPLPEDFLIDSSLATVYVDFAEADRELAEEGLEDYAQSLTKEDAK